eukprot:NODE_28_length_33831_cov_0.361200.p2 type:complete len:1196 gc:universal NODE_28_length_33831_cov_0.361200:28519-24932(-)
MVKGKECEWITTLMSAFQDATNLYLVMEYIPGGDLINLLENDAFQSMNIEDVARFYGAEILLAIEELHSMNFIHRDLKPHNILIKKNGHIKLADFGAAIQLDSDNKCRSKVSVGTPDYICPEILKATDGNVSYGKECDWWSFGTILYEIVCGDPPFYAENLSTTYGKIMSSPNSLLWPEDVTLSGELKDLLFKLLLPAEKRLGKNGVDEIKKHPFFRKVDFKNIRVMKPPFVPNLATEDDTSNFPDFEDEILGQDLQKSKPQVGFQLPFIGFYFNRGNMLNVTPTSSGAAELQNNGSKNEMDEKNIELNSLKTVNSQISNEMIQMKLQLEKQQQSNKELQVLAADKNKIDKALKDAQAELKEMVSFLDKNHAKITELEKQIKQFKLEKEEVEIKSRDTTRAFESGKLQLENLEVVLRQRDMELDELSKKLQRAQEDNTGEQINTLYQQEIKIKEKLLLELTDLNLRYFNSCKLTAELEQRVNMMESMQHSNSVEINTLKDHLEKKSAEIEKLTAAKFELEKQVSMNEHLISGLKSKSTNGDANSESAMSRLLSKADMAKNSLQADLKMMEAKLKSEQTINADLEAQLAAKESLLNQERQNTLMIQNEFSMKDFLGNDKLEKITRERDELIQFLETMKSEKTILSKEIHSLKHGTANENKIRNEFEERLRAKEKEILMLKAKAAEQDTLNFELENTLEDIKRVVASKDEFVRLQDSEISKLSADFKQQSSDLAKLRIEYELNEKKVVELTHSRDLERKKADAMHSEQEGLFARLQSMEKEIKGNKAGGGKRERGEIRELSLQLEVANKRIKDLERDSITKDGSSSIKDNTFKDNISVDADFSQLILMGDPSSKADTTNLTPNVAISSRRKSSYEVKPPVAAKPTKRKLTVSASISNNGDTIMLRGWVNMPKGDKISKGFRKKFLVLKEFQLWGYEREKDLNDEGKGSIQVDVKSEIFVISQIGVHELGGLSSKDFDLGFKVQFMKLPSVALQKDSIANLAPTKLSNGQKLLSLKRRLAVEERMQLSAEKYLNFAAEGARAQVLHELEKSRDLISSIDLEIQSILEKDPTVEIEEKTTQHNSYVEKVEKAIEREEQFIQGVKKMSSANFWKKSGDDLNKELQNSLKRLAHLRMELEKWKKDNDNVLASIQELDTARIPENGHYFKEGYVKQEVSCDLCLEMITGNPVQISQCDSISN